MQSSEAERMCWHLSAHALDMEELRSCELTPEKSSGNTYTRSLSRFCVWKRW